MTTIGSVRSWFGDEGWGVVDSPETPGGCWTFFSDIQVAGYKKLTPGESVHLDWEAADQDGFRFRAVRVWPVGTDPVETPPVTGSSAANSSTLTITFDPAPDQLRSGDDHPVTDDTEDDRSGPSVLYRRDGPPS